MSAGTKSEASLQRAEQRLKKALVEEAERWTRSEPQRLAAACRTPRQAVAQRRFPLGYWATAAAGVSLLTAGLAALLIRDTRLPQSVSRPAVVTSVIDREALYAALPKIPALPRVPPPVMPDSEPLRRTP